MAKGKVVLDVNMILNLVKNDRTFETIKGIPRDAYAVSSTFDDVKKELTVIVESDGIVGDGKTIPLIDIELFGNADAVDENGELKTLKPASIINLEIK